MKNIKRIMVGLDLTPADETLISYTAFLSGLLKPEKIYFIHVADDLEISDQIRQRHPDIKLSKDEALITQMRERIKRSFEEHSNVDVGLEVLEGNPTEQLLHWVKVKNIDLLITGKKRSQGTGVLPVRLTRMINCPVLFVPQMEANESSNILVPVDFSDYSRLALEEAITIAAAAKGTSVTCLHIYRVPQPYYSTGKTFSEVAEIMKADAMGKFEEFIEKVDAGAVEIEPAYLLDEGNGVAEMVMKLAEEKGSGLIVVGAKGRTALSAVLLGSFTEKLMAGISNIPLLVIKDAHNRFGLMDAIKNM